SYLQGDRNLDSTLATAASFTTADATLADLRLDHSVRQRVEAVAESRTDSPQDAGVYYFHGPEGTEKRRAVEALLTDHDRLLRADLQALLDADLLDRFRREALLRDCPVHLTNVGAATTSPADAATHPDGEQPAATSRPPTVDEVLDSLSGLERDLFLTSQRDQPAPSTPADTPTTAVEFPDPSYDLQCDIWNSYVDQFPPTLTPRTLASTFDLTQGQIDDAVEAAHSVRPGDGGEEPDTPRESTLSRQALIEGCKQQSAAGLENLAEQIHPDSSWDDLVVRNSTGRHLREVAAHITHRATVYGEWGFKERFSRGTGVVGLFSGPSGTGKTLAAEVIAAETGMDI
ncbi:MAG: AAA family ATPase, partial [Halobaculum sp.]